MGLPVDDPVVNMIVYLWSVVKMQSYESGKQYESKAGLWKANKITISEM